MHKTIPTAALAVLMMGGTSAQAQMLMDPHQMYRSYVSAYNSGYTAYPYVISDPIEILPPGAVTITAGGETFYFANGVFYQRNSREQKYLVVPPPIGAVVHEIPKGYQMLDTRHGTFYVFDGVYYKRVLEGYQVIPPVV